MYIGWFKLAKLKRFFKARIFVYRRVYSGQFQAEIDNYRLAHNLKQASNLENEEMTLLELRALQTQSASDHKITGINWKSILFPGIPMLRVLPPVLHIQ